MDRREEGLPALVRERVAAELERQAFAFETLAELYPDRQEMWDAWVKAMTEARRSRAGASGGVTG